MTHTPITPNQERNLILLVAMIQFVNIIDFMMVMPLGPDFATGLNIPLSHIGIVAGSYTFSAALAGLLAAPFLDRFSRKKAMLLSLGGVIVATLAGAFAWDLSSMLATRILAGIFGGQMFALSQAVIADFIPPERRGRAMGKVAGGFAVASMVGIPFGLELAARFGWQSPFIATAIMGTVAWLFAAAKLPYHAPFGVSEPLKARIRHLFSVLDSRTVIMSYAIMGGSMFAGFLIIPNISAHFQFNLDYPRGELGMLYFCGGVLSFFGMRLSGYIMDKHSALYANTLFTTILMFAVLTGFVFFPSILPPLAVFVLFMVGMSGRNISATALSSKIPPPEQRGAYMSLQSTVTNLGSAMGGFVSSVLLTQQGEHLLHMKRVALLAVAISWCIPLLVMVVERDLKGRAQ